MENYIETQGTGIAEVCNNCGVALNDGQDFCPKCGTPKTVPKKNNCKKCGVELQDDQEFCHKCGQCVESPVNASSQKSLPQKILIPIIIGIIAVVVVALAILLKGPSVEEIVLSKSSVELQVGDSTFVYYTITPEKAQDADAIWKSSDESVATVSNIGSIAGKSEGSCTITVTADGKSDSLTVIVKNTPNLKAIYNEHCKSTWAKCGSDGSYLSIDDNPNDEENYYITAADNAIQFINKELGFSNSLWEKMCNTSSNDGIQTDSNEYIVVSWSYHPNKGLHVTYEIKN